MLEFRTFLPRAAQSLQARPVWTRSGTAVLLGIAIVMTACSGGPPPDPSAGLGSLPRVVDESDEDGYIVVDLRTRRNPDPGAHLGVHHLVRFDPATGRVFFSDGTVMEADGGFAPGTPEIEDGASYHSLYSVVRGKAHEIMTTGDALRLRDLARERRAERRAEAQRERLAEEERRRQEHLAQVEIRQREYQAALAPILEAGYEAHQPIAVPALGPGEAATQRLDPARALAGRTWLLWPVDLTLAGPAAEWPKADLTIVDLEPLASERTRVLECGPGEQSIQLTVHDAGRERTYQANRRGGFLSDHFTLRDDDLERSRVWLHLPHPFGVSRTNDGHLVLTDGAMPPRVYGVLLPAPESSGPALTASQRAVGERWHRTVADTHARGEPVERLAFPFHADERFMDPGDDDRRRAIALIEAVYQRSPEGLAEALEPMTSWAQPPSQVLANYATAFEMVWHEARPEPGEPINVYEYTADGYRIINNWGTVTESQEAIAEIVKIRTRYAEVAEPAYEAAMKRGPVIDQRATTLKIRRAARLFYDLYPPGSPTAERFEANLYHYLAAGT